MSRGRFQANKTWKLLSELADLAILPFGEEGETDDADQEFSPWHVILAVNTVLIRRRLLSIRAVLGNYDLDSAEVLVRSSFEVAVKMSYIAQDPTVRADSYLRHGLIDPQDHSDPDKKIWSLMPDARHHEQVPRRDWVRLSTMCQGLGADWPAWYDELYPRLSTLAHGGSHPLPAIILRLNQPRYTLRERQWWRCALMFMATRWYLIVASLTNERFRKPSDRDDFRRFKDIFDRIERRIIDHIDRRNRKGITLR